MERMIAQFVVIPSGVSCFVERKISDTVLSYMLWVILKNQSYHPVNVCILE